MTQPIINSINLAQEEVAKQCHIDKLEPNQHVHYYWLLQFERQIKDWIIKEESYKK